MSLSQRVMVVVFSSGVALTFAGCDQQGPAEKAGRQMDEAGKAVGEKVEKARLKEVKSVENSLVC